MSGASCEGFLTITWEIRNCSIIFSVDSYVCLLDSSISKIETRESEALFKLRLWNANPQNFELELKFITGRQVFDQYEMSLVSSDGEIFLMKVGEYGKRFIEKSELLLNKQYFLPGDTLTVRCSMRIQELKTEDFIIRSVLKEVNFHWDVNLTDTSACHVKLFEESDMLFRITLRQIFEDFFSIQVHGLPGRCGYLERCNILIRDGNDEYDIGYIHDMDNDINFANGYLKLHKIIEYLKLDFELIIATHNEFPLSSCVENLRLATHPGSATGAIDSNLPCTLSNDLLLLYRRGTFSDVTLKTEDKSLFAHKNILSARSKYFRDMFEKHMKEGHSGIVIVDIDYIESATLDRMLLFLYGESLDDMSWIEAYELYYAADKYAIDILKHKCGEKLSSGLTVSNACNALVLADAHGDEELMRNTIDFVRDHDEVISSAEWQELLDSNPRLAAKVNGDLYSFIKKEMK